MVSRKPFYLLVALLCCIVGLGMTFLSPYRAGRPAHAR